tara:strand:- start:914 stop:1576 length:663 start_codon:yes stop_codon:yes gene_type:complete
LPIKRLIAVGCSWTYGAELPAETRLEKSYPGLVAKHYGLHLENCGYPGASLESMRWVLRWHVQNNTNLDDVLWLVGLTESTRRSWYNALGNDTQYNFNFNQPDRPWNNHVHSVWLKDNDPDINPSWYELNRLWIANCYDAKWAEQNHWETVATFASLQNVVQFNCLINPYKNPNVITNDGSFRQMLKPEHLYPGKHPNETGHEIISKHLIDHIDRVNILT